MAVFARYCVDLRKATVRYSSSSCAMTSRDAVHRFIPFRAFYSSAIPVDLDHAMRIAVSGSILSRVPSIGAKV